MGKQKKAIVGSWMSRERLLQLHRKFDEQLEAALLERPINQKKIVELKKYKLLCKDLLDQKPANEAVKRPSAKVIPFEGKKD
jgi:hypothetical protein